MKSTTPREPRKVTIIPATPKRTEPGRPTEVEDTELEEAQEDSLEGEESQEGEKAWEESNDQEDSQDEEEEQSFQPSMVW